MRRVVVIRYSHTHGNLYQRWCRQLYGHLLQLSAANFLSSLRFLAWSHSCNRQHHRWRKRETWQNFMRNYMHWIRNHYKCIRLAHLRVFLRDCQCLYRWYGHSCFTEALPRIFSSVDSLIRPCSKPPGRAQGTPKASPRFKSAPAQPLHRLIAHVFLPISRLRSRHTWSLDWICSWSNSYNLFLRVPDAAYGLGGCFLTQPGQKVRRTIKTNKGDATISLGFGRSRLRLTYFLLNYNHSTFFQIQYIFKIIIF